MTDFDARRGLLILLIVLIGITAFSWHGAVGQVSGRQATLVLPYTEFEWWLSRWTDNELLCRISSDHEGLPTAEEVLSVCGSQVQYEWLTTPPCMKLLKNSRATDNCTGLYLQLISSTPKEREVIIELPPAVVWISLDGCKPLPPENRCETLPALLLTGEEPLPNEEITAIEGTFNERSFRCESSTCTLPLSITSINGVKVEFWAESSYGDRSETFSALVRVVDSGVDAAPGGSGWYVDVLSNQWRGSAPASCSQVWNALPPVGGLRGWLATPETPELLASDITFYYLAGRLIAQGVVDGTSCTTGGLLPNGYADACGLELARPLVETWQNQFDTGIIDVAQKTDVPAQLMKNLFAQESQFWPGVFRVPYEFGLGQITDNGADTVLLWNSTFFNQFCPLVLDASVCQGGYLSLLPADQAMLRGALALTAKADCPSCPDGVDLSNVDFSLNLFAKTIRANCDQVSQIIYTATQETAGDMASYEDLWRFTIANYHAGPGCLSYAIHTAWQAGADRLTWEEISARFTEPCKGVVPYVEKIAR